MDQKIITKFRVATEDAISELLFLTRTIAIEKYAHLVTDEVIEDYISGIYNDKHIIDEMNSFGNQWLVVYIDEKAIGYAFVTTQGKRPEMLEGKKAICIADFCILKAYLSSAAKQSLMDKCLSIGKGYEALWLAEQTDNPLLSFFEDHGFIRGEQANDFIDLDIKMNYMIKKKLVVLF
ncbi:N-acetyltransferase [Pedobacter sp. NJ-S-72]